MKTEYKLESSRTGGLQETYKTFEEIKKRYNYIKEHKEEFVNESMIFAYKHIYNEEGKITAQSRTLGVIDFKEN